MLEQFLGDNFEIMTARIFFAAFLSGIIGFEREIKNHPAGFRTHLLVGIGSCLMMLMSLYGFNNYIDSSENIRFDPARIPSYVISGIGFLGAGTILVKGATVRGLTTAASIWVVAGIGLIVGVGMFAPALLTTIVVLLSLIFLNKFEHRFLQNNNSHSLHIVVDKNSNDLYEIIKIIEDRKVPLKRFSIETHKESEISPSLKKYVIEVKLANKDKKAMIIDEISQLPFVYRIF
ncbi:MgtC/SapB family protein [Bacillus sp. Marseille-P3661]|uniref:MgtC/SapB family protein n=1 Tax=Bacillus sp. Marseille-P3661 TaxID=1936234 RepID=UPI000C843722|nr:MgtC/SapB family protein [Bacillus sp. Marseille-P3661]